MGEQGVLEWKEQVGRDREAGTGREYWERQLKLKTKRGSIEI